MSTVPPSTYPAPQLAMPPQPRVWPMVLGVIAIILGAMGALGGCIGAVVTPFAAALTRFVPEAERGSLAAIGQMVPTLLIMALLGLALALLLLFGGIGLVRRRPYGATVCLTWSVLKLVYVVVNSVLGYLINLSQMEHIEAMQKTTGAQAVPAEVFGAIGAFAACFGIIWGWALPIFMLIWFTRRGVRSEIRQWSAPLDAEKAETSS
jgi:hypothetical protein